MFVSRKQLERFGDVLGDVSMPSRMNRKHHGGGKPDNDMPAAPDYAGLAKQQANMQSKLLRQQTQANRINQYTPWGSLTYSRGGNYDKAAYNAAMKKYNKELEKYNQSISQTSSGLPAYRQGGSLQPVNNSGYSSYTTSSGGLSAPKKPSKSDFGYNPDQWSSTVELSPELQEILDQNISAQGESYSQLMNALNRIGANELPAAAVNAGETGQEAIMRRLNPQLEQQEAALRNQLVNQGLRPGTEAWDREYNLFNQQRNDALSQAALHGINVSNDARARALAEQGIPLNLINAYLSGSQAQMPQFPSYSQQGVAQSPDLMGAGQAGYNAQMQGYNAGQASNANFMGGLFGLGGSLLGAPSGGFLGSILGF